MSSRPESTRSRELATTATVTVIETTAERTGDSELAYLAPAAAAALNLLADAIKRGGAPQEDVVEYLKKAGFHTAFAAVLDNASNSVVDSLDDPYEDADTRLHSDDLAELLADYAAAQGARASCARTSCHTSHMLMSSENVSVWPPCGIALLGSQIG